MPHPIHLNKSHFKVSDFKQLLQIFEEEQPELLEKKLFVDMVFVVNCLRDRTYWDSSSLVAEIVMDGRTLADDEFITFVCPDHMRFVPFFR